MARRHGLPAAIATAVLLALVLGGSGRGLAQDAAPAGSPPDPFLVFRAGIVAGTCDNLGEVVYPLADPGYGFRLVPGGQGLGTPEATAVAVVGSVPAIPAATSTSTVPATIRQLVAAPHAVNIYGHPDHPASSACGPIGGVRVGDDLVFGLREQNGSGYVGIAHLHENPDGTTTVALSLASGLTGDEAEGAVTQSPPPNETAENGDGTVPTVAGEEVVGADRDAIPDPSPTALAALPDNIEEVTIAVAGGEFAVDDLFLREGEPTVLHVVNRDDRPYRLAIGDLVPVAAIAAGATTDVEFTTPNARVYEGQLLAAEGDLVLDTMRVVVQAPGGVAP